MTEAKAYRCDRCDLLFEVTDVEKLNSLEHAIDGVVHYSYHFCLDCCQAFLRWMGTEQGKKDANPS